MPRNTRRPFRRLVAIIAAAAASMTTIGLITLPARAEVPTLPSTVSADALPTWQINGVVWSQAVVGNTVYVVGSFSKARPPGVAAGGPGEVTANNIFAFDIRTGNPVPGFGPSLDAQGLVVRAAPDGRTVYVGGDFTTVDGRPRAHIAAFDVATGALLDNFAPRTDGQVRAFAFVGNTVYAGGNFRSSNGQSRTMLAAYNATDGALLPWSPVADGTGFVWSMISAPDGSRIIVSGSLTQLNGGPAYGMGALDAVTGANLPWAATDRIRSAGANGAISSLSTDGVQVYGTGYAFGSGASFEGTFAADPYTGNVNWVNDCLGDTYDSFPVNSVLYSVSHAHDCSVVGGFPDTSPRSRWQKATAAPTFPTGTITRKDAYGWDFTGLPSAGLLHWYPDLKFGSYTSAGQAAWSVTGNSDYVVMGGEFPSVNGIAQQGLVRFASRAIAPNTMKPINNAAFTPAPYSNENGIVKVGFSSVWDRDDTTITYDVYRGLANGSTAKIAAITRDDSEFWKLPTLSVTDNQAPGTSVRYQVRSTDSAGNVQWSAWSPYVTVSGAPLGAYRSAVRQSGASHYWRLGETTGTTLNDDVADTPGTATGLTLGAPGALNGDPDRAITSTGGSTPKMTTKDAASADTTVSVEAWVKTTSTRGGRIVGYGDGSTGTSSAGNTDRVLYLDNAGRVNFAINDGAYRTVYSRTAVNDGQWHHVVGTVDAGGVQLYVDGVRVGRDQNYTTPKSYVGYWRIGADQTSGLTNRPSDAGLAGSIDDVAVYPKALTKTEIQGHYSTSGRTGTWSGAPADAYGTSVAGDQPDLYWRLNDAAGTTTTADAASGGTTGNVSGTVTRGVAGVLSGNSATAFNGSNAVVVAQQAWNAPKVYSTELWFKTTSTAGGKLIGFGNAPSGLSSSYDRQVVMQSNGRINFGTYNGGQNALITTNAYNDGQWHYLVATQGPEGMRLWIDSQLVGSNAISTAQSYLGYWRIGGDRTWGNTTSNYLNGTLDEVAVYPKALTEQNVRDRYTAAGRTAVNRPPVAAFTTEVDNLALAVDGRGSTDPDGNLSTYAWDFGDGITGTGPTASHRYAAAGTYSVRLTVTDAAGLTSTTTRTVTAQANQAPTAAFSPTIAGLTADLDASSSADTDGTISGYAWDFGDGTTGTGATVRHAYAASGDYPVTLTVTDDDGATAQATRTVTVAEPPNQAPTAAFGSTKDELTLSVDAGDSTDPDGTLTSYAWDFGDGSSGSGRTASHTYAADGTYTISLTVTDDRGGTDSVTRQVSVAANRKPVAAFTARTEDLAADLDAGDSADPDGSVASYTWDFGDGATGTGATVGHRYDAAGTYAVTLTVTDDRGLTDSVTRDVTVTAPAVFARDDFGRVAGNGWGDADRGGAWTMTPGSATALGKYSVSGGTGQVSLAAGNNYSAYLGSAPASTDTELKFAVSTDKVANGGGFYVSGIGRQISAGNDYRVKIRIASTGAATLWLVKAVDRTETVLATKSVSGLTYAAGDTLNVRFQVTGTDATSLRAKVWPSTAGEPSAWTASTTDSTTPLQAAGVVGVNSYLSASTTNGPVVYSYDNLWAGVPQ